jgi:hypothetical protein
MRSSLVLIICVAFAVVAGLLWVMRSRVGQDARGELSAQPAAVEAVSHGDVEVNGRLAAIESRLRSLEDELHAMRDRTPVASADQRTSEAVALTPEQFTEQYRESIARIIDDSRHEQAWLVKQDELRNLSYELTHFATTSAWDDASRNELFALLVREFKPTFDLQWRLQEARNDPKVAAEIREPRKAAWQQFYSALTAAYPAELADHAFVQLALQSGDMARRSPSEVHEAVEKALR